MEAFTREQMVGQLWNYGYSLVYLGRLSDKGVEALYAFYLLRLAAGVISPFATSGDSSP